MTCDFIITRGPRKGDACGVKPRSGGNRCSKHVSKQTIVRKVTSLEEKLSAGSVVKKPLDKKPSLEQVIKDLFDKLNKEYLNGEYKLIWDTAKRRLGQCCNKTKEISISKHFFDHDIQHLLNTVRHEVAHACAYIYDSYFGHHGQVWKKWAIKLGAEPKACTRLDTKEDPKAKWVLRHIETGEIYKNYYRKPKKMGKIPRIYIPGKKKHTLGQLEIITK